jgi:hypothetical protein
MNNCLILLWTLLCPQNEIIASSVVPFSKLNEQANIHTYLLYIKLAI